MVRKTLGYVELEWTCPKCGTRNPGPQKSCSSCGAVQPKNVEFQQPAQEVLLTDEAEIARAKAGPDVHCAFCGARNPAGTEKCTQCGADLGTAEARESGRVLGAHRAGPAKPIECPKCGALNDPSAAKCAQCNASLSRAEPSPGKPKPKPRRSASTSRRPVQTKLQSAAAKVPGGKMGLVAIAAIALLALLICTCIVITRCMPKEEVIGQVQAVSWTRTIAIEELGRVTKEAWRDQIPAGAERGRCIKKYRRTQDNPAPNATEVCGTPYTIDKGTGHGQVVQDCQYKVYDDSCEYTVEEWKKVNEAVLSGADFNPQWPNPVLGARQRQGERKESYEVIFETEKGTYTWKTSSFDRYAQCRVGSRWKLMVNAFGGISSIEPAG